MVRQVETVCHEERLKELGIEIGQLRGDTITIYKYLRGCHVEDGADLLFQRVEPGLKWVYITRETLLKHYRELPDGKNACAVEWSASECGRHCPCSVRFRVK